MASSPLARRILAAAGLVLIAVVTAEVVLAGASARRTAVAAVASTTTSAAPETTTSTDGGPVLEPVSDTSLVTTTTAEPETTTTTARAATSTTAPSTTSTTAAPSLGADPSSVFLVGDSITVGASSSLYRALGQDGWTVTIDGKVGRTTSEGLTVLQQKTLSTDYVVIELGYNDAADVSSYRARLAAVLDEVGDAKGIVLVDLNESRSYYATANDVIADLASTRSNVVVADWASQVAAHPSYVVSDGIHLSTEGATAYAALVAAALS